MRHWQPTRYQERTELFLQVDARRSCSSSHSSSSMSGSMVSAAMWYAGCHHDDHVDDGVAAEDGDADDDDHDDSGHGDHAMMTCNYHGPLCKFFSMFTRRSRWSVWTERWIFFLFRSSACGSDCRASLRGPSECPSKIISQTHASPWKYSEGLSELPGCLVHRWQRGLGPGPVMLA